MSTLFNIHDIVLLLTALGGLLLGVTLLLSSSRNYLASCFLACFFFSVFIVALCTLMFWSSRLRPLSFKVDELMTFLYILAQLVKGPSLYFYVASISVVGFKVGLAVWPHFAIPLIISFAFVMFGVGVDDVASFNGFLSVSLESYGFQTLMYYSAFCYACMCAMHMQSMKQVLKNYYSCFIDSGSKWFDLLVYGYITFWGWQYFSHLFSGYLSAMFVHEISVYAGLMTNYFGAALFFSLFVYSISHAYGKLNAALVSASQREANSADDYKRCLDSVLKGVERDKLYLESNLNIERFSSRVNEKTKDVSLVINDQFKSNFFEFINRYRVEEAKRLLLDEPSLSVIEIMMRSGFNSKSSFNRVFKKMTDKSPSQFRQEKNRKHDSVAVSD